MSKESEEGTGGRQARQRGLIAKPGDQGEKPEKNGAVYGEILFFHQQRLATPLVFSNVLVLPFTYPQFRHWNQDFLLKNSVLMTY